MRFFKKKPINLFRMPMVPESPQILIRQLIYDSGYPDPEAIASALGLSPLSEEVSDMETKASLERFVTIVDILPFISAQSDLSAKISAQAYALSFAEMGMEEPPHGEIDEMSHMFQVVASSAVVSCFAYLTSIGALSIKKIKYKPTEGDSDE